MSIIPMNNFERDTIGINCNHWHDSYFEINLTKLIVALKYTFTVYTVVHGVPLTLFKLKYLKTRPKEALLKYLNNIIRSMSFLG